jgi:hypothetical protein
LHNIGLPIMACGLTALAAGNAGAEPLVGIGSAMVLAALLAFTVNMLKNGAAPGTA